MSVTTVTTPAAPFGAITAHRVISGFENVLNAFRAWNEARRTVDALRRLSPKQLDDIGLTQADIDDYAAGRF